MGGVKIQRPHTETTVPLHKLYILHANRCLAYNLHGFEFEVYKIRAMVHDNGKY